MLQAFKVSENLSFVIEFGDKYIRFYTNRGILLDVQGNIYEISSPYSAENLKKLKTLQGGDYLYLFHPDFPIKTLGRYANTDWRIEDFELKSGPWDFVNTTENALKISAVSGNITITADQALFSETDAGRLVRITNLNNTKKAWQADKDVAAGAILYSDGKYYQALAAGKTGTLKPTHTEGSQSDGSVSFKFLHTGYGVAKITKYLNAKQVEARVISEFPDDLVLNSSTYWELGLLHNGMSYPIDGAFYRNRFCFLLNHNGMPKVCFSCSEDFNNFADKEHGEILATSSFTVSVSGAEYNDGQWLCSASVLFVGTSSGEYYIAPETSSESFGPENSDINNISFYGSKNIHPVKIGAHIIFVSASGTTLRDIVYSYATDSYEPADISLCYKHLLQSGITGMIYQESPDKILWLTVNDGRLIGITFSAEQEVNGAHQHFVGGNVKNFAVISTPDNNTEDLWLEVEREINGETVGSVEWMDNGTVLIYPEDIYSLEDFDEKEKSENRYMKENAFFVDGGLSVVRDVKEYSGILHLKAVSKRMDDVRTCVDGTEWKIIAEDVKAAEIPYNRLNQTNMTIEFNNHLGGGYYTLEFPQNMVGAKVHVQQYDIKGRIKSNEWYVIGENLKKINIVCYWSDATVEADLNHTKKTLIAISNFHIEKEKIKLKGLEHLEGREVAILADGAERERQVVKNGEIEVWNTDKVISAGLPVESIYIPQTVYLQNQRGCGFGDLQRIDHLLMMLYRSSGGKVGGTFGTLQPILYRKTDEVMGKSVDLFTGNKTIPWPDGSSLPSEQGARIIIYNDTVFPMNILALCPYMEGRG